MSGWKSFQIGEVCTLMTGGTPSRSNPAYFEGDVRWLVSGDIHQNEIFECGGRISRDAIADSNARFLPKDSVMIALNGQGKTKGTVALLRVEATCNQSLVCIIPKDRNALLPEFLFWNLKGRYSEIRRMTSDEDSDRRGLNMPMIRSIGIPVPPLAEQRRIVTLLDEAFAGLATMRANAEANLKNARALFQSHLNEAFSQVSGGGRKKFWRHM